MDVMDEREWARLETRLSRIEASLGLAPEDIEQDADLILRGQLLHWRPGAPFTTQLAGLPNETARWLAGDPGDPPEAGRWA